MTVVELRLTVQLDVFVVAPTGLKLQFPGVNRSDPAPEEKVTVPVGFDVGPASVSTTVAVTWMV